MFKHELNLRVRYSETDRMGYCYYGNYAQYFEVGRVEALRALGITYKEMENEGIMLPVVDYHINYKKPAFYDDELTIKSYIKEMPTAKIIFEFETLREDELLNKAEVVLVFVNKESGRPCPAPYELIEKLKKYIG